MYKGCRYRIYPTKEQIQIFEQYFGASRFVYNWGLDKQKEYYKAYLAKQEKEKGLNNSNTAQATKSKIKSYLSYFDLGKELTIFKKQGNMEWLSFISRQALICSLVNLDKAYSNFFKKNSKYPQYKKKYSSKQSFQYARYIKLSLNNKKVILPNIGEVKIKLHKEIEGKIKTCTITKTPTNKYYIGMVIENDQEEAVLLPVEDNKVIGISFGINNIMTTDKGEKILGEKYLSKREKQLKRLNRKLSKKKKGSKNREKARKRLAIVHEKIANARKDMLHKISHKLVYKSQDTSIALPDYDINKTLQDKYLSKDISDSSWRMLRDMVVYKTKWCGKNVIYADRYLKSAKTCSKCQNIKACKSSYNNLYRCKNVKCNLRIDKGINAAINIKRSAIAAYRRKDVGLGYPEQAIS